MNGGWVEPVTLTHEQRDMIRRELAARRIAVFKDNIRQDAFLRRIEGTLTFLRSRGNTPADPGRSQYRIAKVKQGLQRLQLALNKLEQFERCAIEQGGQDQIQQLVFAIEKLLAQTISAQDAVTMPRGAHDPPPGGRVKMLVVEMANAWLIAFERTPSPKPGGAFFTVTNIVLGQLGEPEMGKDALTTVLKGAGLRT